MHYDNERERENISVNLMLGDCLERMKEIPDGSIDAIICDPPFNIVEKVGKNIHIFRQAEKQQGASISRESMSFDVGFDQISWLESAAKTLKKSGNFIIFNDWENLGEIAKEARRLKLKVKMIGHWQKPNPVPAEWGRRFVSGREYFIHLTKGGKNTFNVSKLHFGEFNIPLTPKSEKKHGKHPNQKPLRLMTELVGILTNEGDIVLDPFMGSCSTGVACVNSSRNFIGIELNEGYFKISQDRINDALIENKKGVE
jgi:site-specific DNA-methyltransferase (adenine-specific)